MPSRKSTLFFVVLPAAAVLAASGFIWSGAYDVGADSPHTRPVHRLLEIARERSILVRAAELDVPDLRDPVRIVQGSGNYQAMCAGCHLAPGMAPTELSQGLYPAPPDLTKTAAEASKAFWVVKHGIKASGMPAWGKSMPDEYIWNIAAFLQELPDLTADEYQAMVARSGGHSHGGGESMPNHGGAAADGAPTSDENDAHAAHPHADAAAHAQAKPEAGTDSPGTKTGESHSHKQGHSDDGHKH